MNQHPNDSTSIAPGPWLLATLILLAALSRLLPHPPNFSPVEAVALFGGFGLLRARLPVLRAQTV